MSRPRVGSLFAGVEGFGQGLEAAGFEVAWQVEIDKDAVSVLERHYPSTHRVRDVREAGAHNLTPVDVLVFGSPCQGFSVAGRCEGLEDARSGLFGEAIRIIRELRPAVAIWENVPGAFSANNGRDFGAVLAALAESGAVDIVWRVLDAQWFGVPQRRRRIFLVADFGGARAAQILFESEGGGGNLEACGEAGQGLAGDIEDGSGIVGTVPAGLGDSWNAQEAYTGFIQPVTAFGGNRTSGPLDVATACLSHSGHTDFESETFIVSGQKTNAHGSADVTCTLNAHGGPHGRLDDRNETFVVASSVQVSAGHHGHSSPRGDGSDNLVAVAISENQRAEVRETPYARQVTAGGGKPGQGYPSVRQGMAVRRLTPRECERLMGWPDDWTRYRADGSEIPDGPRYRMIGNGVVAPVARWIGERLLRALSPAHPSPDGREVQDG